MKSLRSFSWLDSAFYYRYRHFGAPVLNPLFDIFLKITPEVDLIVKFSRQLVVLHNIKYIHTVIFYRYTFDVDIRLFSNFGCKLHKFLVFWNGQTTALVLIVMTTERFITISFPHQTRISISKKKLACFLIMLSFCAACLTSHYWWTYSLYEQNNYLSTDPLAATTTISTDLFSFRSTVNLTQQEKVTVSCVQVILKCSYQNSNYIEFISQYWPWINLAVYSIIPFLIITTLNLLLLIRLSISIYERKKRLGQVANTFTIGGSSLLLISAGLLYLFCTGPIAVFHIFNHVWRQHDNSQLVSDDVQAQRVLMRVILENISYLTNALNILVYCISGSRFQKRIDSNVKMQSISVRKKAFDKYTL